MGNPSLGTEPSWKKNGPPLGIAASHFAASAEPCRIWPGEAAAGLRRAGSSSWRTPPPPGRTSSGSGSCGCWCCAWPSHWGVSARSSRRWSRWTARSHRAIPGRCRSARAPVAGQAGLGEWSSEEESKRILAGNHSLVVLACYKIHNSRKRAFCMATQTAEKNTERKTYSEMLYKRGKSVQVSMSQKKVVILSILIYNNMVCCHRCLFALGLPSCKIPASLPEFTEFIYL